MDSSPDVTIYQPSAKQTCLHLDPEQIPRFLLRVSSDNSNGSTSATRVVSGAVERGYLSSDVLSRPNDWTADRLKAHVNWWYRKDGNFVSWTSSIIFALQHAVRKANGGNGCPSEDPSAIQITIVDVRNLPIQVFLPSVALLEAYNLIGDPDIKIKFCRGEYLSQGALDLPPGCAISATLEQLNALGLDRFFTPHNRYDLWEAVDPKRQSIKRDPKEPVTTTEWRTVKTIAQGICSSKRFRTAVTLLLLSIKPRYRLDPMVLEVFTNNNWATWMTPEGLEPFITTSKDVPEHLQFVHMMHDVQAQAQRHREMPQDSQDEQDLTDRIASLSIVTSTEGSIAATTTTCLSLSTIQNTFYELGPEIDTFRSSILSERKTAKVDDTSVTISRPVSTNAAAITEVAMDRPARSPPRLTHILIGAKEMWQAAMEEDREEQETVAFQIEDTLEEDRPCIECGQTFSVACYRKGHFAWCTMHERMVDEEGACPDAEIGNEQSCTEIRTDMDENEAHWAEVEENATTGGAGFRDFD